MKNNRGLSTFGSVLVVFMGIIVALAFITSIAQSKGQMTDLATVENASLGVMTNGTTLYITAYKSCSSFKIFNATGDVEIPSTNYTVTNNVVYNGQEAISVAPTVTVAFGYNKGTATYDGTCQPLGYISESSGRTVAGLIVLFSALALAGWVIVRYREDFSDLFDFR